MSTRKRLINLMLVIIFVINVAAFADYKDDAQAIKISGGENHSFILTQDKQLWGSGDNEYYQLGIHGHKSIVVCGVDRQPMSQSRLKTPLKGNFWKIIGFLTIIIGH